MTKNNMLTDDQMVAILQNIQDVLGEDYSIERTDVTKSNDNVCTGISIRKASEAVATVVYPDVREDRRDVREIADNVIQIYRQGLPVPSIVDTYKSILDFKTAQNRLFIKLCDIQMNKDYLMDVAWVEVVEGIAAVPFVELESMDCDGMMSTKVTLQLANMWGVTTEDLYGIALANMNRQYPPSFMSMEEALGFGESHGTEMGLYVLTNVQKIHGASSILYPHVKEKIYAMLGHDFYIIPSSIHEVLIVPDTTAEPDLLKEMVQSVNDDSSVMADRTEILSYGIWHYDGERLTRCD